MTCANHLTMVDSFVIAIALGSPWWYVTHFGALPWNTPERDNFSRTWWLRLAIWVMKCIPVERGGDRREVGRTLERFGYVLAQRRRGADLPGGRPQPQRARRRRGRDLRRRARREVAARLPRAVRLPARRRAGGLQRRAGARRALPRAASRRSSRRPSTRACAARSRSRGRSSRASRRSKRMVRCSAMTSSTCCDPETARGRAAPALRRARLHAGRARGARARSATPSACAGGSGRRRKPPTSA